MYTQCPKCKNNGLERVGRKWWMRVIPKSRYFKCYLCGHTRFCGWGAKSATHVTANDAANSRFYVEGDDVIYGPAALKDLQTWARNGRLSGEHRISADKREWKGANTLAELGLTWRLDFGNDSTAVLLHPQAVHELCQTIDIPKNATMTDITTGKTTALADALAMPQRGLGQDN